MDKKNITIDLNISGILSILLIMFIILKVAGVISWSWGIVLLPLWIWLGMVGIVCFLAIIITIIVAIRKSSFK